MARHAPTSKQHFAGLPVKFVGYLHGRTRSREAYASADIFVFPSALETFGLVVVEAMAAGLPVVSSRVGGVRDVVEEGVTGYTFDVNDVPAMVEGVRRIAVSREHMAQMGAAARAFADTQSWDAMMDEVIDLYRELIAANAGEALLAVMTDDWRDPSLAQRWSDDPTRWNPLREETVDVLLHLIEAVFEPGRTLLDLGSGSGLVEASLFERVAARAGRGRRPVRGDDGTCHAGA